MLFGSRLFPLISLSRACVCVCRAARWVFNLSKHNNVVDSGPPPDTITSTIDKKRPGLGGLVWINAVLGNLHCCLQKGVKNKAVTPVPTDTLDGWLNGQTGFWWIGALKEGHRALWDSHVVMNWAMVFIPSSPEVRLLFFSSLSVRRCVKLEANLRLCVYCVLYARSLADQQHARLACMFPRREEGKERGQRRNTKKTERGHCDTTPWPKSAHLHSIHHQENNEKKSTSLHSSLL